jgi:hypothetical protein
MTFCIHSWSARRKAHGVTVSHCRVGQGIEVEQFGAGPLDQLAELEPRLHHLEEPYHGAPSGAVRTVAELHRGSTPVIFGLQGPKTQYSMRSCC